MVEELKIYNSLTRKKEVFKPQDPNRVTMYTCGPTVYGPAHLGHARTYANFDFLKRALEFHGYKVEHVLNITDVHDSMIEEARMQKVSIKELAARYIRHFHLDLEKLNIEPASAYPQVTEHIVEIIQMILTLVEKGYAYEKDGSVYYDVSKFKNYGELSCRKLAEAKTGTRVAADKYEREEVVDFALWKKAGEGEEEVGAVWDSPWGKGRPGWHIECSAMSQIHLGKTLDIHGGGMDLKFPHHENEIAQSEAATGKKFANFWVHSGTLLVEGKKMSKSIGNIIDFDTLVQKEFNPLAFRYLCLTTHYRGELNFTWAGLEAAAIALEKLYDEVANWDAPGKVGCAEYENKFDDLINDDLNLPKALALMWELVKDQRMPTAARMKTLLEMDRVFGLKLAEVEEVEVPKEVRELARERERARREGNWTLADEFRDQIEQLGFTVEDTEEGPVVKRSR
uniref:Cysteine--tRNA ligase n=1 Tax=candidate division WWE3 bacterium TaxID=2053526 RepID=A0A831YT16_UNCKA